MVEAMPVTVVRNRQIRAAGLRLGDAVAYDWGFRQHGRDYEQRSFVLVDEGFQLSQPPNFPSLQTGWWYCDLVRVAVDGDVLHVDDDWIDVIVGPGDHPYRVLDLDEFGEALRDGVLGPAEAAAGLARTQAFLDRHLNRRHGAEQVWPDFPPESIEPLLTAGFERVWSAVRGEVAAVGQVGDDGP
jgi:hypothetical protein